MSETRKLAAILVTDVVGYSRLAGADEDRTLARLRGLRSDLIDPATAAHHGRVVKGTGDGSIIEFRSVVDAVRCAIEVQTGMIERNAGVPPARRIEFRVGIHIGDVVEESDGDLMGDGVNIAAWLQGVAKPAGICLSEDAYRQVKARLDLPVTDLGRTQLKNIAEPIRVFAIDSTGTAPYKSAPPANLPANEPTSPRLSLPDQPSIAVLPFQNLSGDAEQGYFADGIVEDIITAVSRIKWLFLIARNSSFTFKGRAVDVRQVGRELGARYVLEGGVRKAGARLRITARLIETETGAHLWADKFDAAVADVFDLQDRIAESVTAAIEPRLFAAEHMRIQSRRPESLDAWGPSNREIETAQTLLTQAVEIKPGYPRGNSLSASRATASHQGWAGVSAVLEEARAMARKAIQAGPDDPWSLFAAGYVHMMMRDFNQAVAELTGARQSNTSSS
jgi:adenylate cyclase